MNGFYLFAEKFTNLNTFVMKLAHKCSDNEGPTVENNNALQ